MRTRYSLLALALLIALPAWAAIQQSPDTTAVAETATVVEAAPVQLAPTASSAASFLDDLSKAGEARATGWSLPSCQGYNGTFCASGSTYFRCMNAPFEPGICVCQNNTWHCG